MGHKEQRIKHTAMDRLGLCTRTGTKASHRVRVYNSDWDWITHQDMD